MHVASSAMKRDASFHGTSAIKEREKDGSKEKIVAKSSSTSHSLTSSRSVTPRAGALSREKSAEKASASRSMSKDDESSGSINAKS